MRVTIRRNYLNVASVGPNVLADLGHAECQRLAEALLLLLHEVGDAPARLDDLRGGFAQDVDHRRRDLPEEGPLEPEHAPVAHGPTHGPAQHVTPPFVRRPHPAPHPDHATPPRAPDHLTR